MNDKLKPNLGNLPDLVGGKELQTSAAVGAIIQEVQGAMILAKHFPRDYMSCWSALEQSCKRASLAKEAIYSYPRGGKQIEGPSVYLARVAAQCYGNIRTGMDIVRCDDELVHIRAWAWDIESNSKASTDDVFKPLILRRGNWIKPDERDLRELINRRGAIAKRNAIFEMLPRDYIDDAVGLCKQTVMQGIKDPKSEAKLIVRDFNKLAVSVKMIRKYIGHEEEWDTNELFTLRSIYTSIADGNSKKSDYFGSETSTEGENGKTPTENLADDLSKKAIVKPEPEKQPQPKKKKADPKPKKQPEATVDPSLPPEPPETKPEVKETPTEPPPPVKTPEDFSNLLSTYRNQIGEDHYTDLYAKYGPRRLKTWTLEALAVEFVKFEVRVMELVGAVPKEEA